MTATTAMSRDRLREQIALRTKPNVATLDGDGIASLSFGASDAAAAILGRKPSDERLDAAVTQAVERVHIEVTAAAIDEVAFDYTAE